MRLCERMEKSGEHHIQPSCDEKVRTETRSANESYTARSSHTSTSRGRVRLTTRKWEAGYNARTRRARWRMSVALIPWYDTWRHGALARSGRCTPHATSLSPTALPLHWHS